jgi:hypothetical protein
MLNPGSRQSMYNSNEWQHNIKLTVSSFNRPLN